MRYIPQTKTEREEMLQSVGISSSGSLFECIPKEVRLGSLPELPAPLSESQLVSHLSELASKNRPAGTHASFLGAGVYDHYVPAVINHMLLRQEFYTAYTPYQPEISQGTLSAIFEYQTMICSLTGMDVSNASLYDSATGGAESMMLAASHTRRKKVLIAQSVHPEIRTVMKTYAQFSGIQIDEIPFDPKTGKLLSIPADQSVAAVFVQSPNFFGVIEDLPAVSEAAHSAGALAVCVCDPLSLALLTPPGECDFDIAIGETQPLGLKMSFGGPYAGFMAVKEKLMRKLPGRIVGETTDTEGRRAYVLTLQAREQHIRREKATSNICSNQALCALASTIYLSLLGPEGLRECAEQSAQKAAYLQNKLVETGKFKPVFSGPFFREFAVSCSADAAALNRAVKDAGMTGGFILSKKYPQYKNCLLLAVTEQRTKTECDMLAERMAAL